MTTREPPYFPIMSNIHHYSRRTTHGCKPSKPTVPPSALLRERGETVPFGSVPFGSAQGAGARPFPERSRREWG